MTEQPATPYQIDYWNNQAGGTWAELQEQMDRQLAPLGERAIQALAPVAGEKILDVGCGCGDSTLTLGRAVGAIGEVVGLDVSQPMLEVARRRGAESGLKVGFIQADAETTALGDDFDAIYSRFGVMFFDNPTAAFRNLLGALKPGGRLAFVCWRPPEEVDLLNLPFRTALFGVAQLRREGRPITVQSVAIAYTRLDGIPLGRYWRPLFAWFGDLDLVPHLWQMVCLGETEAVVTFFPPVDIDRLGDRKKLADYCFREVSGAVQAANTGRYELLPPPADKAA